MSVAEIYAQILEKSLYVFHAQDPISVLRGELRSHSVGIDFPTASPKNTLYMMTRIDVLDY